MQRNTYFQQLHNITLNLDPKSAWIDHSYAHESHQQHQQFICGQAQYQYSVQMANQRHQHIGYPVNRATFHDFNGVYNGNNFMDSSSTIEGHAISSVASLAVNSQDFQAQGYSASHPLESNLSSSTIPQLNHGLPYKQESADDYNCNWTHYQFPNQIYHAQPSNLEDQTVSTGDFHSESIAKRQKLGRESNEWKNDSSLYSNYVNETNMNLFRPAAIFPANRGARSHKQYNSGFASALRWSHPVDPLGYPVVLMKEDLGKIVEWQLAALIARNSSLSHKLHDKRFFPTNLPKVTSQAYFKGEIATISASRDNRLKLASHSTIDKSKSADNSLLVCQDLKNIFGYSFDSPTTSSHPEYKEQKEKRLDIRFNRAHKKCFHDNNFEVRPTSVHVPVADGTYESEDGRKYRLDNNVAQKTDQCNCLGSEVSEELEGPYYTHLAAAPSIHGIRKIFEQRMDIHGSHIRIEKVVYTGKEGKTQDGCPVAKWVIRRRSKEEKLLVVVRERPGHKCATAVQCIVAVLYDGIPDAVSDDMYSYLSKTLPEVGMTTNRRCALNDQRSCACQGMDDTTGGASFSFGCSWSMYYNTCKFAKSKQPKRFKLNDVAEESVIEKKLQSLSDMVSDAYCKVAPASYSNQTYFSYKAQDCRLGNNPWGPFTGVTACVDFCSHSHKDVHNMSNGCTVVLSLTKQRGLEKADDEQLHVLPLYIPSKTDEYGSEEQQMKKVQNGGLEMFNKYPMKLRYRNEPLPNCKERSKRPCNVSTRPSPPCKTVQDTEYQELKPVQYAQPVPQYSQTVPHQYAQPYFQQYSQPFPQYSNVIPQNSQQLPSFQSLASIQSYYSPSSHSFTEYGQQAPLQYNNGLYYNVWPYNNNSCSMRDSFPVQYESSNMGIGNSPQKRKMDATGPPVEVKSNVDETPNGFYTMNTDNEHIFEDSQTGGVAIALTHGSILFEVAKRELHATTALKVPDRRDPKRISLVFYEHKNLNFMSHGYDDWQRRLNTKKLGLPDLITAQRAAAAKIKFDLALPKEFECPMPMETEVMINDNLTEPSWNVKYSSCNSCKYSTVESKDRVQIHS